MPSAEVTFSDGRTATVEGESREAIQSAVEEYEASIKNPDPIGAPLPSEERGIIDKAKSFVTAIGNEAADVRDFLLQTMGQATKVEQETNPFIPEESRQRIAGGIQENIDEIQDRSLTRQAETEQIKATDPIAGTAGQIVGEIASLPIGGPTKTIAKRIMSSGGQGGLAGAVEPASSAGERIENIRDGVVGGLAGGAALESAAVPIRKAINSRNVQNEVIEAGEREGVPVFFDDVTQSGTARKLGALNENVPVVGSERGRIAQNRAARAAGERRVSDLKDEVRHTGGDPDELFETLQSSLQERLAKVRGEVSASYKAVDDKLQGQAFTPTRLGNYLDQAIKQENARGTRKNQHLIDVLTSFKEAPELANGGDFAAVRQLRKELADEVSEYYRGENVNVGAKGVELLQQAKTALERDLEEFAFKTDRVAWRAFKDANKEWQEKVLPFKQRGLRELVQTDEPEKAWRYLVASGIKGGTESRAQKMYRNLTPKGRAAVRLGLVQDAFQEAAGDKSFSAAKFASSLEKRENIARTFFQGPEAREIEGMAKLMRAIERSGQVAENPPTGNRLAGILLGGAAVSGGAGSAATMATSSLAITQLFQTPTGRNFLMSSAASTPGTAKFDQLVVRLERWLARSAGRSAEPEAPQTAQR